jgi:NitT/TauT family transport system substrate-binding protein
LPKAKGYFAAEKLDVTIDAGNGSGNAVNRVASGTYQIGFADLASLIEFVGNNPTAPNKPVAVMMVYDSTPAAVFSLKKTGIKAPADLQGKKMGAPVFDAGRRAFPIFVKANKLDASKIAWTAMDAPLRETMLAKGDVDVMMYAKYGVNLYSNAIIVSEPFLKEKPEAVKAFLRAFTKGMRDVLADPDGAIKYVKERDALVDEVLEKRRLRLAIDSTIITPEGKADGFGAIRPARMNDMVTQVSGAFELKSPVKAEAIFDSAYLPAKADRMIYPK